MYTFTTKAQPTPKYTYRKLLLISLGCFLVVAAGSVLSVDKLSDVLFSRARTYKNVTTVMPIVLLQLVFYRRIYTHKVKNAIICFGCLIVFVLSYTLLRTQTFVNDVDYIRTVVPRMSSSVMASKNAQTKNPEVNAIRKEIIRKEEAEIRDMKRLLDRLEKQKEHH